MIGSFQRVAIVNRGESAMRFIRAARDYNRDIACGRADGPSVVSIALYTDADRRALFVREADEAYRLGPARVAGEGGKLLSPYLDYATLEEALQATRAEAAWVGWGFVAEQAAFAELCERLGVVFIGPSADVIRQLGDKIQAKKLAEESAVPVAPWSGGELEMLSQAVEQAELLGYPLMLKAAAGGGGRGIRRVRSRDDLGRAFESARTEARNAFGDDRVFLERLVPDARHIEVQVIGDSHGDAWAVGLRDCSVQRRNQKVLEESGSTALSREQSDALCAAAVRLARNAGYQNAGTVEFLYDPVADAAGREPFAFMEVNTRLQVEHPVTEVTTGVDLVKLQIDIARGGKLPTERPGPIGYAIEARLNAEDPYNDFMPAPGRVAMFRPPLGPGVRVDSGLSQGDEIPPDFDSMIAKVIAHGRDRDEAIGRLTRALAETTVVIEGGTTNKSLLLSLLEHPMVRQGQATVAWLESAQDELTSPDSPLVEVAVLLGAVETADAAFDAERANFQASALRGRPEVTSTPGVSVELTWQQQALKLRVNRLSHGTYRVTFNGNRVDVSVEHFGLYERRMTVAGRTHRCVVVPQDGSMLVEVDGRPHRLRRGDRGLLRAPAPAVVLAVNVDEGKRVAAGDRVIVLEAMKMEMPLTAPFDGVVKEVRVRPNVQVEAGAPLVLLEADETEGATKGVPTRPLDFGPLQVAKPADSEAEIDATLSLLRSLMLGFDVEASMTKRLVDELDAFTEAAEREVAGLFEREAELLAIFSDIHSLFRGRQGVLDDGLSALSRSSEEHLLTFLRTLDEDSVPPRFIEKLKRTLSYYGIANLDPGDDLNECLVYVFKAHQHMEDQAEAVGHILARWLNLGDGGPPVDLPGLRSGLDRLVGVTRRSLPNVSDLAREVRHAFFDRPMLERARNDVLALVERHLGAAVELRAGPHREPHTRALIEVHQPLVPVLLPRFDAASDEARCYYLDVLTRRHYRYRSLQNMRTQVVGGFPIAEVDYGLNGQSYHLLAMWSLFEAVPKALAELGRYVASHQYDRPTLVDLYLSHSQGSCNEVGAHLSSTLSSSDLGTSIDRIAFIVGDDAEHHGRFGAHHYTFEGAHESSANDDDEQMDPRGSDAVVWQEDVLQRGFHPRMGERLQLWRLENFEIERLPSDDSIYLFRGVARENARDERLFAFSEVRDLTPVRDAEGRIQNLPQLEASLLGCLHAIRHQQAGRAVRQRLHWNRVYLYIWPIVMLAPDELENVVRRLAPETEGLGLEKVVARARVRVPPDSEPRDTVMEIANPDGAGASLSFHPPHDRPLEPLAEYEQKVIRARQRGLTYPYEVIKMMTTGERGVQSPLPPGTFQEYDLDESGEKLVAVERPYGKNSSNIITGIITNRTEKYPEGMSRVMILSDPTRAMGAIAEPECRRINAALDLAEQAGIPAEWFAVCAGATIAMDTGTENLDWTARVIRRLIELTQTGHEINVVVAGINVGAQSYWNAEATMLMHCKGVLIMTAAGSMVLTGKRALDYSGSVSADDNFGIGGYERIMGPNGEAQYWARDVAEACLILMRHYDHAYTQPGERFPRRAETTDPENRDVCDYPHGLEDGIGFETVGEIFSDTTNPGRKRPFSIRRVMAAVVDQDYHPMERWSAWQDAEIAVVWDGHLGGWPVCLIGIESKPLKRVGLVPSDGPDRWTAGTLFPRSSKKVARAINACSASRPVVILANLSGFDGSPESMRRLQLEYGAEIGRAVVNFDGPIVFCVVSRYHGGAYVVFSNKLNEHVEVAALEGAYASVIGGAPAAAVVFARDVKKRTQTDPRIVSLQKQLAQLNDVERGELRRRFDELAAEVHSEKLGQVADEFDNVHTVQRALQVGSLDQVILPRRLRPYLIDAVTRGIERVSLEPRKQGRRLDIGGAM